MSKKRFTGIELDDSHGNKITDNKITSHSENSTGIHLKSSNDNEVSGNQILSIVKEINKWYKST